MIRKSLKGILSLLSIPVSIIIITNLVWYVIVRAANIPFNITVNAVLIAIDCIIAYFLFDRLIYFFAQFVLPIQNSKQRKEIYSRVKEFEPGSRGPALFIKNGSLVKHKGEENKHGPGVIVLDTASAAVLRTDTEIKDTIGPGVVFTKSKKNKKEFYEEYLAGYVDLRTQWQFIGPQMTDQPFLNQVPVPPKPYNDVQKRRQQTSGMTRDGIEVSPTISIKFRIKRPEGWPEIRKQTASGVKSHYGYDEDAVRNAITREVVELGDSQNKNIRMEWNKLPEHLVVNIWREYICKFKFDDLFTTSEVSGLKIIEEMINKRVKQYSVEALGNIGSKTSSQLKSLEFQQLQARGLEIIEVRIHNAKFDDDIDNKLVERWSAEWLKTAQKEEKQLIVDQSSILIYAREAASKEFARLSSKQFNGNSPPPQKKPFETLKWLILPLMEFILNESKSDSTMEEELKKIGDIWKWLLVNNSADNNPMNNGAADYEE